MVDIAGKRVGAADARRRPFNHWHRAVGQNLACYQKALSYGLPLPYLSAVTIESDAATVSYLSSSQSSAQFAPSLAPLLQVHVFVVAKPFTAVGSFFPSFLSLLLLQHNLQRYGLGMGVANIEHL